MLENIAQLKKIEPNAYSTMVKQIVEQNDELETIWQEPYPEYASAGLKVATLLNHTGDQFNFDYRDELEVEWAGHPNWFFRLSKFSLPFLHHPTVPRSWFLNQLKEPPRDLENFVLKPLFSFAGSGVKVHVTQADLDAIPEAQHGDYLLQEKITYAPVIQTPDEPSKVELRLMSIWPDDAPAPIPAMYLGRMSKGAMMGVDFNKNKSWVGSTACYFEV